MQKQSPNISGVIAKFHPKVQAAVSVSGSELIKNTFANAIEYRGVALGTRGMATLFGVIALGIMPWFAYGFWSVRDELEGILYVLNILFISISLFFGVYLFVKAARLELFRLEDEPIIFDRRNRKVYRIYREVYPGWRGVFKHWPTKFSEHSWDLLDAEHHAAINANHAGISRIHGLIFQVRNSSNNSEIVDGFSVGSSMLLNEISVPTVWEHIRRFMEENGPHIVPGEAIVEHLNPTRFSESVANAKKIFLTLRQTSPVFTICLILLFPITLPVAIVLTISSWLSYRTAIPIKWPDHVLDAIGPPLTASSAIQISEE